MLSQKILKSVFKSQPLLPSFFPLCGDASDRSFVRMESGEEGQRESYILMIYPDCRENSLSDFIEIQRLLQNNGLPVPEVLGLSIKDAVAALQDLGDETLQSAIGDKPETIDKFYCEAVEILAKIQSLLSPGGNADCIGFRRQFDKQKFFSELEFFRKHYIEGLLGKNIKKSHRQIMDNEFSRLSGLITNYRPQVFTHRDFHSRNLMVTKNKIMMIDFQDARLGPPQYDLVSLLRDSYIELDEKFINKMITFYFECREKYKFPVEDKEVFMDFFHLCSLQRNLKAIGTFAFQKVEKGKDDYIKYIPLTFLYVKGNPLIKSDFSTLADVLDIYVEW